MKIAYLSTFYPYRGGIAQFNASLYRELEKNHEIKAFNFSRQYPDLLFPGSTQFVSSDDHADQIPSELILDSVNPFTYYTAANKILDFKPDLLIMKFWMPFFAPSLGFVASRLKKSGTKIITILDNVIPHEKRIGDIQLINYFLNQNHGFIAMSETVERDLISLKPNAVVSLKPHPIYSHFGNPNSKTESRIKLNLHPDKKTLLFFGFIRDYKGLDLLIEASQYLNDDYQIIIAGEVYGNFEKYVRQIELLNAGEKFHQFIRYIDDSEVPFFFSAADVCVLPYKSATQSGIVQIAYNFDLPVIATNVGGLSEMVLDNETGLILSENSSKLLAEKIEFYFSNHLEENFREGIRSRKSFFSWNGFAEEVVGLFNELKQA